ncbi:unnamed protein product [Eruca vesicaria subsp. sativa]|uniref:Myb/SANT-like DNA-binding domain-containing protein n=1 Tax=Eruca vesicaria subsp. sativa TaxID=29727 RepID=A0ABC8K7R6_ERUVS|nr:unnamed protein product [Eruca vesicaria subsp. sativa]
MERPKPSKWKNTSESFLCPRFFLSSCGNLYFPRAVIAMKGKWKSVSRAMVEKGFSVPPQQCEDKFNDLNKRYKRVNDILGKGTRRARRGGEGP